MAETKGALTNAQLQATITKLGVKLARQTAAVKDTEAHISALQSLIDKNPK